MSNNNNRDQRYVPMSEKMTKKERELPNGLVLFSYLLPFLTTAFIVLYTTGAWESRVDEFGNLEDFDVAISVIMFFAGIGNLAITWFIQYLYRKE